MNHTTCRHLGVAVTLLAVLPTVRGPALAQSVDLAEQMPEGAVLYMGWAGCEHAATAAKETAIGKTLADPQVRGFFKSLDSAVDGFFKGPMAKKVRPETYEAARRLVFDVFLHPGAISVIDFGLGEAGLFGRFAFILKLEERADGFVKDLQTVLQSTPMPPAEPVTVAGKPMQQLDVPLPGGVFYGAADGYFILAGGRETVERIISAPGGAAESLARSPRLTLPREKIGGDGNTRAMTLYLDVAGLLERARMIVPMFVHDPQKQEQIWRLISALGLDGVQSLCWETHYRRQGCFNGAFVHTSGEPRGLLAMGSTTPLSENDLALIPKQPYWATAFGLNPGRVYAEALSMFEKVDAEGYAELRGSIAEAEEALGLRLDKDLFDLLGEKFIIYDAPGNGGLWFTGATLIVESADPERLRDSMGKIVQAIAKKVNEGRGEAELGVSSFPYLDHRIEFVNVTGVPMPLAPAWSAHGKRIIVGLYPQMVMAVLDRMLGGAPGDSLSANPDFVNGSRVLGGIGSTMTYVDTKRGAQQLYALALPLAQMGAAMVQDEGVRIDISSFPTQRALTQHMFGHMATTHHHDDGILYAAYGPLPFGMAGVGESAGVTTALAASIVMPSLVRARTLSKRVVSGANLRGITICCKIYANEHNEEYPPDLDALVRENCIAQKQLHAPADEPGRVSYVYLAGQGEYSDPRNILAHERPDLNKGEGVNAAFVDGHVEFLRPEAFERELQATRERMKRLEEVRRQRNR